VGKALAVLVMSSLAAVWAGPSSATTVQAGSIQLSCDGSVGRISCNVLVSTVDTGGFEWRVDGRPVSAPGRSMTEAALPGEHRVEVRPAGRLVPVGTATVVVPELPSDDEDGTRWWIFVAPVALVAAGLIEGRRRRAGASNPGR
jgi:MYXO-CTERM domain-containing protein